MKKIMKKNQVVITALAIMIAVAGYLNFSDSNDLISPKTAETMSKNANKGAKGNKDDAKVSALLEDELPQTAKNEATSQEDSQEEKKESEIGEAVLTNAKTSDFLSSAKLTREQNRAKNEETLQKIISNSNVSEKERNKAADQLLKITKASEKEENCEQLLGAKGFKDSIVAVSDESVDVMVHTKKLTDVQKAQIEDIVTRKTGYELKKVTITTYQ